MKTCKTCKGKGAIWMVIKPIRGQSEPDDLHWHYVECPIIGCVNGKIDRELARKNWGID